MSDLRKVEVSKDVFLILQHVASRQGRSVSELLESFALREQERLGRSLRA